MYKYYIGTCKNIILTCFIAHCFTENLNGFFIDVIFPRSVDSSINREHSLRWIYCEKIWVRHARIQYNIIPTITYHGDLRVLKRKIKKVLCRFSKLMSFFYHQTIRNNMEWRARARDAFLSTSKYFLAFESIFNDIFKTTANDFVNNIGRLVGVCAIILRSTPAPMYQIPMGFMAAKVASKNLIQTGQCSG